MKNTLFALVIVAASSRQLVSQRAASPPALTGTIIVRVLADTVPVAGAAIAAGTANSVTDRLGVAKLTLPTGRRVFHVTPVGFRPESLSVFVGVGTTNVTIPLHHKAALPGVFVAAARDGLYPASKTSARGTLYRELVLPPGIARYRRAP